MWGSRKTSWDGAANKKKKKKSKTDRIGNQKKREWWSLDVCWNFVPFNFSPDKICRVTSQSARLAVASGPAGSAVAIQPGQPRRVQEVKRVVEGAAVEEEAATQFQQIRFEKFSNAFLLFTPSGRKQQSLV